MTSALRKARLAVAVVFLVNGTTFATWAARVPAVRDHLNLSPGALGVALLGLTAGAVVALPMSGALVARYGGRRMTRVGLLVYCLTLPLIALAPTLALLAIALAGFGAGNSILDVAMNAQGVEIEQSYKRPILASFHALWSFGGLAGAVLGAGAAAINMSAQLHFAIASGLLLTFGLLASGWLLPAVHDRSAGPAFARPTRKLAVFGAIAFCSLLTEGVVNDWSAIYLRDVTGASSGLAAAGYATFSLTMAGVRLVTDRLVARIGPGPFVRGAAVVAATGLGLALLITVPVVAVIGFGLLGAGLAGVVPVVIGVAGGRGPAATSGSNIAAVSTIGYLGFLTGPVLIGTLADLFTLRVALLTVVVLAGLMTVLASRLDRRYPNAKDG